MIGWKMIPAKWIFATALVALIVAGFAFALTAFGITQFRFLVYVSVLVGVVAVAVGSLCRATGKLKNDLYD
ncbi:hypothetical protein [Massilia horti]|uniref:Transmembrane protein n=1 Tax=Massilia horti TaxID=2562153 RepID=A0A4Y9SZ42_9BURK|nr:hypothetical protein [Massilia horti]TFW31928.1 hypothetical protein E4O92_11730 [Massilia horti]